jgi:GntR family transcriptional regulator
MNLPVSQIPEFATGITGRGPLYREIQNQLLQGLAQGEWSAGSALPTEPQLAQRFGVSIGTIRKAIGELVDANILVRQQGRGTFVATHNVSRNLFHFFHIVAKDGVKRVPMPELISFEGAKASADVAVALDIARGEKVFRVLNLQRLGDVPVCLDELHIAAQNFTGLTRDEFANRPSTIYALYQTRYLINVVRTVERLRARSADAATAKILGLKKGAPVLEIHRVAYTYDDRPVELRVSRVNTEQHDYFNTLT